MIQIERHGSPTCTVEEVGISESEQSPKLNKPGPATAERTATANAKTNKLASLESDIEHLENVCQLHLTVKPVESVASLCQ